MLVILRNRYGDDWNPWFGESMWEDADGMGEHLRGWSDYETALKIVRLWVEKHDKRREQANG